MGRFNVHLKDGQRYVVEASSFCCNYGLLILTHPEHGEVAAFPFMSVEGIVREGSGELIAPARST